MHADKRATYDIANPNHPAHAYFMRAMELAKDLGLSKFRNHMLGDNPREWRSHVSWTNGKTTLLVGADNHVSGLIGEHGEGATIAPAVAVYREDGFPIDVFEPVRGNEKVTPAVMGTINQCLRLIDRALSVKPSDARLYVEPHFKSSVGEKLTDLVMITLQPKVLNDRFVSRMVLQHLL